MLDHGAEKVGDKATLRRPPRRGSSEEVMKQRSQAEYIASLISHPASQSFRTGIVGTPLPFTVGVELPGGEGLLGEANQFDQRPFRGGNYEDGLGGKTSVYAASFVRRLDSVSGLQEHV
jgi:hypothetical protein